MKPTPRSVEPRGRPRTATPMRWPTAWFGPWSSWPTGRARWRDSAGEEHAARLGELLTAEQTARAWRTALNPAGEWMPAVIAAADTRLQQKRQHVPDAGGMVIVSGQTSARLTLACSPRHRRGTDGGALRRPGSSDRISHSRRAPAAGWLRCRMVSEGVACPAHVGVYTTSASTPLFFAQAIGRFVRTRRPGERPASSYRRCPTCCCWPVRWKPSAITCWASRLEGSRGDGGTSSDAVRAKRLGQRLRIVGRRRRTGPGDLRRSSFGTATPAGSEEEADYLGIPGLLDAEQMRDLLRRRQEENLTKAPRGEVARPSKHGQLRELRRELNALVTIAHHHRQAPRLDHNELRRICGGPPIAAATTDQLKARIEVTARCFSELSRC